MGQEKKPSKFCWQCGKQIEEGHKFCKYCGIELQGGSTTKRSPEKEKRVLDSRARTVPLERINPEPYPDSKKRLEKDSLPNMNPSSKIKKLPAQEDDKFLSSIQGQLKSIERAVHQIITSRNLPKELFTNLTEALERIEYKVNALNVENIITDFKKEFDEIKIKKKLKEIKGVLDKDVLKDLIKELGDEIKNRLEAKMEKIEQEREYGTRFELAGLSEKVGQMGKQLKEITQKITEKDKVEEKVEQLTQKMNSLKSRVEKGLGDVNDSLNSLVPALVKLTRKVKPQAGQTHGQENKVPDPQEKKESEGKFKQEREIQFENKESEKDTDDKRNLIPI